MSKANRARITAEQVEDLPKMEYASVTVSVDHLVRDPHPNGHAVVKSVFSTESAVEALLAQLDYFGDNACLRRPGILSMISKGEEKAAIFVYEVNENLTNIIVDAALWHETVAREETILGAHSSLMTLAADMKRTASAEDRAERVLAFISE